MSGNAGIYMPSRSDKFFFYPPSPPHTQKTDEVEQNDLNSWYSAANKFESIIQSRRYDDDDEEPLREMFAR